MCIRDSLQYITQISEPVTTSAYIINSLQNALVSVERVYDVLELSEETELSEDSHLLDNTKGQIVFENVSFGYSKDVYKRQVFGVKTFIKTFSINKLTPMAVIKFDILGEFLSGLYAILSAKQPISCLLYTSVGGLVAGVIGFIIGIPALRLTGDYLAIITLAFGEIIRVLIEYFKFTGGAQGLTGIPRVNNFTLIYFITIFSVIFMYAIMTSRHGRAILRCV